MRARIAESFARSLARLEGPERAAVKRAAFDFLFGPRNPGLHPHRLVHCEDSRYWSLRVNRDLRVIVHRDDQELVLCYADHHDRAYAWAAPRNGAPRRDAGRQPSLEMAPLLATVLPVDHGAPPIGSGPRAQPAIPPSPPRPAADPISPRRLRVWRRATRPLPPPSGKPVQGAAPAPLLQLLQILHGVEAGRLAPEGGRSSASSRSIGVDRVARPPRWRWGSLPWVALAVMAAAVPLLGLVLAVLASRSARKAERARVAAAAEEARLGRELAAALERLRRGERPTAPLPMPVGEAGRAWAAIEALDRFLALEPGEIRSLADAGVERAAAAVNVK
jgi:hypothetical protein